MLEQTWIKFYKVSPGGNTTILLDATGLEPDLRPALANTAMNPLHLSAEQVGFIDWPDKITKANTPGKTKKSVHPASLKLEKPKKNNTSFATVTGFLPNLNMMGGEFCANACRSYAAVLALEADKPFPWRGEISSSGIKNPVSCFVQECNGQLDSAITVPLFNQVSIEPFEGGALVRLPGITHILLPGNNEQHVEMLQDLKTCANNWKRKFNLINEPAVGCIWFDLTKAGASMLPLVWVRDTDSYCLETACGSGAMALGLYMGTALNQPSYGPSCGAICELPELKSGAGVYSPPYSGCSNFYRIQQPSGETLWVAYNYSHEQMPNYIWLGGPCQIIAKGKTII